MTLSGAEDVLRYSRGIIFEGYNMNLGICFNNRVEAYAAWQGLKRLKEKNYEKIILEGDLILILDFINDKAKFPWKKRSGMEDNKYFLRSFLQSKFQLLFKEGHMVANEMENLGLKNMDWTFFYFPQYPSILKEIISLKRGEPSQ
ncbi:hypothetical protein SUGI_0037070 [Cryptomeria japonica]|nr:hypothetical protein SUGI_0037070 [Cryptomeria japonica]